jgi:hypothetical protein
LGDKWQAYADNSANFGLHVANPNWLLERVLGADKAGLQVRVTTIFLKLERVTHLTFFAKL